MKKFKVGDRVVGKSGEGRITNKKGTIIRIRIRTFDYSVEFDENVDGHSCDNDNDNISGKPGYCWNCEENQIKFIETSLYEIY